MNRDMCRWILEFLLSSSVVPDTIAKKVCTVLPLPGFDSRLGKMLALKSIESEVAKALFTETSLECLELIEEIDCLDGTAITQAMKEAYCAVAVECSVRYLDPYPGKNARGLFDVAVNKTWRGRIRKMMEAMVLSSSGKICHLLTPELIEWKDVIESARWDAEVCERLTNMNTRKNALDKVRAYLQETRASMGPSYLESAALLSEDVGLRSSSGDKIGDAELAASIPNEGCDKSVSESALVIDQMNIREESLHCSTNRIKEGLVVSDGSALQNAAICMEKAPEAGGNQDSEQLGETDLTQRINEAIRKGKMPLEDNHDVPSTRRGVIIIDSGKVGPATVCSKDHNASNIQAERVQKSLASSSLEMQPLVKDPLPDALHKSDLVGSELATKAMHHEPPSENQGTAVNVPEQNTCWSMVPYQPIDDNLKEQPSANHSNSRHPGWMERDSTAHTYEWGDSFNDLPGGSPNKRRKKVKWSSEEEDALREGVKKIGRGSWKQILRFHSEIFNKAGRTEVDLKDKWRNLTRWP
ncbi:hypothetical protein QN277_029424 [Acacia crassicarpa]|uniref:Uncharacterized protein n=1 Tax=Acacia crassicarpa TaxID=499986 RepID=A0AAE1J8U2_9FABA|nr:hypothetical protein QN277_029424 [Acacia crassicarpa]